MSRADRRHHLDRLKTKRFKQLKEHRDDVTHKNDKIVGKHVRTPKVCSDHCCGNPRKFHNEKTRQEVRMEQEYT